MDARLLYVVSMPERLPRAVAASAGGLLYESTLVLLPEWTRNMQLYQALIGRMLRITVEWAGGVQGLKMPTNDMTAGRLAVRKVAGNVVEFTSIFAVGWSPLWMLAAAADVTGGTQVYLHALTEELQRLGVLPAEQELASVDALLESLEGTTGVLSRAIDIPPLARDELDASLAEMRTSWQTLRDTAAGLPSSEGLKAIAQQLQITAERENTSVWVVSTWLGLGAVKAGVRLGQANIYDYYRTALTDIYHGGLVDYVSRVSRRYLVTAVGHLDPEQETYTERILKRVRRPRVRSNQPPRAQSSTMATVVAGDRLLPRSAATIEYE